MSIAKQIKSTSSDYLDVVACAEEHPELIDKDQDWNEGITLFIFSDGSQLKWQSNEIDVDE